MRRILVWAMVASMAWVGTASAKISSAEARRIQEAAEVVRTLRDEPDNGIPEQLWRQAECVVVIPSLKKAAFGIGGEYGRGVMSCRNGATWSAPLFMQLLKGSWGLQIGAQAIDLVLLVMNRQGAERMLRNQVSLGADASVAAGPVGRTAGAATDAQLTAELLTYSRSRGVFAGIDLSGGVLKADKDANVDAYESNYSPTDTVFSKNVKAPRETMVFLKALGSETARATSGVR